jgi:hypothetical protein
MQPVILQVHIELIRKLNYDYKGTFTLLDLTGNAK